MLDLSNRDAVVAQHKAKLEEFEPPVPPAVTVKEAPPKAPHAITRPKVQAYQQRMQQHAPKHKTLHRRRP